ncbi:MAG: flagellar biosynthesis protein FlhB [Planctomycetes bacterium]|nr:flagellar biosynthesis protein FlhB [Planctomycetota bacterium]
MADEPDKEEKTEDATPRRREESREKGQVALSQEVASGLMLLMAVIVLIVGGAWFAQGAGRLVVETLISLPTHGRELATEAGAAGWISAGAAEMALAASSLIVPMFAAGLLACYGQVGFQITPQALAWDPARLDPFKGFGRVFSTRGGMRTLMALAKILTITITVVLVAWGQVPHLARLTGAELGPVLAAAGGVALRCVSAALAAILALALADLFWQRFQQERDMRMSKKEVRDEAKSTEGDPHVKSRVRQLQREMAASRMMQDVPTATVIVTNPTHFAVALRYERDETEVKRGKQRRGAPYVVAKGVDHVAQRIKQVARENEVPCIEDRPLARALHAQVEIGEEVPEQLYQAVATVLAHVYRLREEGAQAL